MDHTERVSSLADKHIALHDNYCARTLWARTPRAHFTAAVQRAVLAQRKVNSHLRPVQEIVYHSQLKLDRRDTETARALASLV